MNSLIQNRISEALSEAQKARVREETRSDSDPVRLRRLSLVITNLEQSKLWALAADREVVL